MARKTIAGLEKIIEEKNKVNEELLRSCNRLDNQLKSIKAGIGVVKQEEYDFLVRQNKSLEIEINRLKHRIERLNNGTLKQENEELKMICKELLQQLKEKDSFNAKVGRKKTITESKREDIRRKYANGESMNKLAVDYNTSKTTIHKIIKKEVNN
jgi:hypothetical protein